jgi:tRNA (Thr-GGU) A37 N-methylase
MPVLLQPIGVIHTPFTDPAQTPIQASRSTALGHIEVFPEHAVHSAPISSAYRLCSCWRGVITCWSSRAQTCWTARR